MLRRLAVVGFVGFVGFVVLLAAALVTRAAALDRLVLGSVSLAFAAGAGASFAAAGQRLHQFGRYLSTPRVAATDADSLPPGDRWLKVEATATATDGDGVAPAVAERPAVVLRVRARIQESFTGIPWFRTTSGVRHHVTETTTFALGADEGAALTVGPDGSVEVVGETWSGKGRAFWPGEDEIPDRTAAFLAEHDLDVEARVFRGRLFTHLLRVNEEIVPDGATARLFGPVTVERTAGGGRRLIPRGRFVTAPVVTAAPWRTVWTRQLRRVATLVPLGLFAATGAVFVGWLALT